MWLQPPFFSMAELHFGQSLVLALIQLQVSESSLHFLIHFLMTLQLTGICHLSEQPNYIVQIDVVIKQKFSKKSSNLKIIKIKFTETKGVATVTFNNIGFNILNSNSIFTIISWTPCHSSITINKALCD